MAKHVIRSDRGTQWVVNKDGHRWIIERQAVLDVDPGPAVLVEAGFDRNEFLVKGDILAAGPSAGGATAIRNDGDRNRFVLRDSAKIEALQGMAGTGDHTEVVNHGKIAASLVGIAQDEDFTLVNTGHIFAAYGVSVAQARLIANGQDGYIGGDLVGLMLFGDGESTVVNKGEIQGHNEAAIRDGDGSVTIRNTGTIDGDVELGGGRDILNSFKGEVNGAVRGGDGADLYRISQSNLTIVEEVDQGNDAVYSTVGFTLPDPIEGLVLKGRKDIDGTGNSANNEIVGNKGDNMLHGAGGDDALIGGGGNDILSGGAIDDDNFLFARGFGKDVITDFEAGVDRIVFIGIKGLDTADNVLERLQQHGSDVWIKTGSGRLILEDIDAGMLDANDFGVL